MKALTEQDMKDNLTEFLGMAFCVDGKVLDPVPSTVTTAKGKMKGLTFEINDTARGRFFVTLTHTTK